MLFLRSVKGKSITIDDNGNIFLHHMQFQEQFKERDK